MIHDKELGLITFKQSLRAKRMSVRILSNSLQVSLPRGYKEKDGLKFIDEIREKFLPIQCRSMMVGVRGVLRNLKTLRKTQKPKNDEIRESDLG